MVIVDTVDRLKEKYRIKPYSKGGRSNTRSGGMFSSDPNNKVKKYSKKKKSGVRQRRRSYGPFDTFTLVGGKAK